MDFPLYGFTPRQAVSSASTQRCRWRAAGSCFQRRNDRGSRSRCDDGDPGRLGNGVGDRRLRGGPIYDGNGGIVDAPKPGTDVSHRLIWGSPQFIWGSPQFIRVVDR
ncbi:hypothetical protein [Glaciihabitans sp. UYNi722]|uniref:hypothetical protein n=1 Tax=Glaciihabitans sp. UYNi722 TaxID=3156344 RepID=UPI0033963A95